VRDMPEDSGSAGEIMNILMLWDPHTHPWALIFRGRETSRGRHHEEAGRLVALKMNHVERHRLVHPDGRCSGIYAIIAIISPIGMAISVLDSLVRLRR
jgi:hypothetical protein